MGNRAATIRERIAQAYPDAALSVRARTSLIHHLPDGRQVLTSAIGPLHYEENGMQREIDTTLIPTGPDTFETADTEYRVEMLRNGRRRVYPRKDINEFVQFDAPQYRSGQWRSFDWTVTGAVDDDRILWDGPEASLSVRMMPTGVKVDIVLKQALTTELRWPVQVSGLNYDTATHSLFSTSDGQTVLYLQEPFIIDANETERRGLNVTHGGTHINISGIDDSGLTYPLTIDPTIDSFQIATTTDDGSFSLLNGTTFINTAGNIGFGWNVTLEDARAGYFRFQGVTIPAGATISQADITLVSAVARSGVVTTTIRAVAQDNPTAPTDNPDAVGRPLTSASVNWNPPDMVSGTSYTTTDIAPVMQEIVDRPGWAANNAMLWYITWISGDIDRLVASYAHASLDPALLTVEYTTGPAPQIAWPVSDVAPGNWTPTPLFAQLDDGSTSTSVESEMEPDNDTFTVALDTVTDPGVDTDHRVSFAYRKDANAGSRIDLTVELLEGTTVIATEVFEDISGTGWLTDTIELTEVEAAAITDYSDLRLRFSADVVT